MIDLSVVVAAYNKAEHLRRNLRSLSWQTYPHERYEVIVVDDGSTDGSAQVVEEAQAAYDYPLHYLYLDRPWHTNPALTWNVGAQLAQAPIFVYAGADIILAKEALALLKYYQDQSDGHQFTFGQCYRCHSPLAEALLDHLPLDQDIHAVQQIFMLGYHHSPYWHVPHLAALPVRYWHELGGHDESYPDPWPEDEDWWLRLEAAGVHGLNAIDCWGIHQYHPQADPPCGESCPCPLAQKSLAWAGSGHPYRGAEDDLVRNREGWGEMPPPAGAPPGTLHAFRYLRADEPYDPQWVPGHWSRPYEWGYVLRQIAQYPTARIHNTGCGGDEYTRAFAKALGDVAGDVVNTDLKPQAGVANFRLHDLREPLDDVFDIVLCISILEEMGLQRSEEVMHILDSLWAQVRPGGRLIMTCDLGSGFSIGGVERWVRRAVTQEGPRLHGHTSVVPQPHRAHLSVVLLDLEKSPDA